MGIPTNGSFTSFCEGATKSRPYYFYEFNYHAGTTIGRPQSSEMYHFAYANGIVCP